MMVHLHCIQQSFSYVSAEAERSQCQKIYHKNLANFDKISHTAQPANPVSFEVNKQSTCNFH